MKKSGLLILAGLSAAAAAATGPAVPASAQRMPAPICLSGSAKTTGTPFVFLAPATKLDALLKRGFAVEPCNGKERAIPQYMVRICQLAGTAPREVKDSLVEVYGIGPDEMCELAMEADR